MYSWCVSLVESDSWTALQSNHQRSQIQQQPVSHPGNSTAFLPTLHVCEHNPFLHFVVVHIPFTSHVRQRYLTTRPRSCLVC